MKRILVIDDEESIRKSISELLALEGFEVMTAENGRAGLDTIQKRLPDLVLCDVMMPVLDGFGVLTSLRKDPVTASIPFVFLTARTDQDHLRVGMNLGADDYIAKPFTRVDLLKSIAMRFERQKIHNRAFEEKVDLLRSSLARSIPHELLSPINAITGYSQIIAGYYDSMERAEVLGMIKSINDASTTLMRLIRNFLLYAELETVATDPEKVKALLVGEVSAPRTLISEVAQTKSEQYNRTDDTQIEIENAPIKMSETNFRKIVEELTDNAFKFSRSGTPIVISGKSENKRYTLTFSNEGAGMTADEIENIGALMQFERRIHEHQGAGLGLSIVKKIVLLHGGELKIDSVPEKETKVSVILRM